MPADPLLIPLNYQPDSATWFAALRHLPHAIWLDSCHHGSRYGRFDIISAAPQCLLQTRGHNTLIEYADGTAVNSSGDPFSLIQAQLPIQTQLPELAATASLDKPALPFNGGALGYFGYDLGRRLEKLPEIARADIDLPDLYIGIYPWALIQDHHEQKAWLVQNPALGKAYNFLEITEICRAAVKTPVFHDLKQSIKSEEIPFSINEFERKLKASEYRQAFARIQEYIKAGDCYQVNYAQRFSANYKGDPFAAYLMLRKALPSPFSGFMQLEHGAVLSLSPERLLEVRGNKVETKPIKGTVARGTTQAEDEANAQWLKNSPKNHAENVMIVDLLRNDLSKHCDRVQVPKLCELQTFANVHHLVSTVRGQLKPNSSAIDVLRASFPGGSITGAPKIRAMEIIEELEPSRRSLYCGSLGYISCDGQMDTSIAIRTLVCDGEQIHCWGGGGIVADSDADTEYQESIAKVQLLMTTLEKQFAVD